MPPARSGVADYGENLLKVLRRRGSVELNPGRASVNLYHLGNNQLHAAIYRKAITDPGVVVLHDAVLHHFALGYFEQNEYAEEFVYNYGEWNRALAVDFWARRAASAADERYFEYPMLRRIAERSTALIVHNPAAAAMVRAHAPGARVVEIPHLVLDEGAPSAACVLEIRQRLGVAPLEPLCGVFGYLRESKRIRTVIDACGAAGVKVLIAGNCPADLSRSLQPHLAKPFVVRTGHAESREFELLLHAADFCANLRYPAAGETSGIAIRSMSAGKPVLMTASTENSRFPQDACIRIESGLAEREHLTAALSWLKQYRSDGREIGLRASAWVRSQHHPERVADLYWNVLRAA